MTAAREMTDLRRLPIYTIAAAAHHLSMSSSTLRAWAIGRSYPAQGAIRRAAPLFPTVDSETPRLSFENLVEAHVLLALRGVHGVSMRNVRSAIDYAERALEIERLLLHPDLETAASDLFLQKMGQLINLSQSGQLAMKKVLADHLRRIERDEQGMPIRLFPFVSRAATRSIAIDPRVSYGRPVIERRGISTSALIERIDAGEAIDDIMADYALEREEIDEVLLYERLAA